MQIFMTHIHRHITYIQCIYNDIIHVTTYVLFTIYIYIYKMYIVNIHEYIYYKKEKEKQAAENFSGCCKLGTQS